MVTHDKIIGFIGMGYVGLPTACLFAEKYKVIGYDSNVERIRQLIDRDDTDGEVDATRLDKAFQDGLLLTHSPEELRPCNVYIIAVPTPIDASNKPDLRALLSASKEVGSVLEKGDIVVYESTVYPGATEDVCVPVLARVSGLEYNKEFFVGYSPERINPGDKKHQVADIVKITSGSTPETARTIDELYRSVLRQGTYPAKSIKLAEAAKVIENAQRDVNIAFVNEVAKVLNALGIDTNDVIDAASSKWNFQAFRPGFVGGHCISVDPYYLISQARAYGMDTPLMCTAREVNNSMAMYVSQKVMTSIAKRKNNPDKPKVLLLGITFKENSKDIRNSKVVDLYHEFISLGATVDICDPVADPDKCRMMYGINLISGLDQLELGSYDAVVLCVCHEVFSRQNLRRLLKANGMVYDVKGKVSKDQVNQRL